MVQLVNRRLSQKKVKELQATIYVLLEENDKGLIFKRQHKGAAHSLEKTLHLEVRDKKDLQCTPHPEKI